jgi:hypothetical protein
MVLLINILAYLLYCCQSLLPHCCSPPMIGTWYHLLWNIVWNLLPCSVPGSAHANTYYHHNSVQVITTSLVHMHTLYFDPQKVGRAGHAIGMARTEGKMPVVTKIVTNA